MQKSKQKVKCFLSYKFVKIAERTKRALMQLADNVVSDQGLLCLLTESMSTVVYVAELRITR